MQMIQEVDKRGLCHFGLMVGFMVAFLFGVIFPWMVDKAFPLWPWVLASFFWVAATVVPVTLKPFYYSWMRLAMVLNWIVTRVVLGFVFFLMILPMGLIMRLLGRDSMGRKWDQRLKSYRVPSNPTTIDSVKRPF